MRCFASVAIAAAACSYAAPHATTVTLRSACGDGQVWDGTACRPSAEATKQLAIGTAALAKLEVDEAKVALDKVEAAGPLDHKTNVTLWEQRGIAAAYVDDEASATKAFDMLLALDPAHFLSYELSPKATLVFEKTLKQTKQRGAPAVDVNWSRGQKVGEPIPIDIEVLADPKRFLARATLFVRTRGEPAWRAADLPLAKDTKDKRVLLPAINATKNVSLELYLRAYDQRGNEVLTWADSAKPRELVLRYDPPPAWYRTWWGITAIVVGSGAIIGGTVYAVTLAPPDKIGGSTTVR
ncbi:MAG TPA: hypothetical protein VIV11_08315 [Kofleriaceae bacterium]